MNTLYYGDNLKILRDLSEPGAVATGFRVRDGEKNPVITIPGSDKTKSQITAFEDTWHWNLGAQAAYSQLINEPDQFGRMIESFRAFIGNNQMMAVRLKELHRVPLADRFALSPLRPDRWNTLWTYFDKLFITTILMEGGRYFLDKFYGRLQIRMEMS